MKLLNAQDEPLKPILFVFDEASALTHLETGGGKSTRFRDIRRALQYAGSLVFGIFMDTASNIWNFAPTNIKDASSRVTDRQGELFAPFILFPTLNILECPKSDVAVDSGGLAFNPMNFAFRSRPLFAAYAKSMIINESPAVVWDKLCNMAARKLLADQIFNPNDGMHTLSVFAARFCVLPLDQDISSKFVSHHMATLQSFSENRSRLNVNYVAEPMIGEACCHHMRTHFDTMLTQFASFVRRGDIGILYPKGNAGEFVASVLLARAFDAALLLGSQSRSLFSHGRPVKLNQYLNVLTGMTDEFTPKDKDDEYFVSIMQFVEMDAEINLAVLEEAWHSSTGLVCRRGQAGADIVIPILILHSDGHITFTLIVIQVKNYQLSAFDQSDVTDAWRGVHKFAEKIVGTAFYVGILMCVANSKSCCLRTGWSKIDEPTRTSLRIHSLSPSHLHLHMSTLCTNHLSFLSLLAVGALSNIAASHTRSGATFDQIMKLGGKSDLDIQKIRSHISPIQCGVRVQTTSAAGGAEV